MRVKILKTDKRLGVKQGEIYEAQRYALDPGKVTLLRREPDGYDPSCNQYLSEVAVWLTGKWMVAKGGAYVPAEDAA